MKREQFFILPAPRICAPVVRICKSAYSRLVSVINGRRSDPCHLNRNRFTHNGIVNAFFRSFRTDMFGASYDVIRPCQETGVIVIGQLVHRDLQRRSEHTCHKMAHSAYEVVCISPQVCSSLVTVFFHSGQKPRQRFHKRVIIHNAVPFVPLQPFSRIAVMLCQDQSFGICLFYFFAKTLPKHMVIFVAAP